MTLFDSRSGAATADWAYETFYDVDTGDRRHRARIIAMAASLAACPAGEVCVVFPDPAEREGAYRLLSNEDVTGAHLEQAMASATVAACVNSSKVFVPVDGSSLGLSDKACRRDIGAVGSWKKKGRGLLVQTALALDSNGTPIGVCAQMWWARTEKSPNKRRPVKEKETHYLVTTLRTAFERLVAKIPKEAFVALLDRGYDCWPVLALVNQGVGMVLRAQYNRRLATDKKGSPKYLFDAVDQGTLRGRLHIHLEETSKRAARIAHLEVRVCRVTLSLKVGPKRRENVTMNAVDVREINGPKKGLRWLLLTTEACDSWAQIEAVVRAYSWRWRIEEFHRVWKKGGGNVEDTQLQSKEGLIKWATMHAAVAARAVRLCRLARTQPELPASEELSEPEIEALLLLSRKRRPPKTPKGLSLSEAVDLLARVGGYAGKSSSGGPPGPTIVARGVERMANAAQILALLKEK